MPDRGWDLDDEAFKAALQKSIANLKLTSKAEVVKLGHNVRNVAVRETPVDTGRARSGWYVRSGQDVQGPYVDVGNIVTEYIWVIEFGSRPHIIGAKNAQVLANKKTGQVFGKVVHHPGTPAYAPLRKGLLRATSAWKPDIHG